MYPIPHAKRDRHRDASIIMSAGEPRQIVSFRFCKAVSKFEFVICFSGEGLSVSTKSMPWNARDDAPDTDRLQEAFRCPNESSRIAAGIYYLVVKMIFEAAAVFSEQQ